MPIAVLADALRKTDPRSDGPALDGFDLAVPAGIVHGPLGPNGAGKTTAVRILATLLRADGGRAEIDGIDVARHPHRVRRRLGLVGQSVALDEVLDGRRNLVMSGRLFHLSRVDAARRADELLRRFGLSDAAAQPVGRYSGGMRRRLDLAVGMILGPAVLFLDEPTTGLDRVAGPRCGPRCARSSPAAPRCCPRPSTSTRPTSSPTGSRCWAAGAGVG